MNKLIFKLFYFRLYLLVLIIFLIGCAQITGKTTEVPRELNKQPKVYFCPKHDCSKVFENLINSANYSAYCAFYDIDLKNMISSLSRKSKSIDVKVVIDSSNNEGVLKGEGIRLDDNNQLMHNKFCVIDEKIVITGSFNPTDNDNNLNNNNIIVFYSSILAENYIDEYDELWNGVFGQGSTIKNPIFFINDIRIDNYFCPEDCDKALNDLTQLLRHSQKSIQIASFTFTNEKIANELIEAGNRGVNVTVIVENRQRNIKNSQYQRLRDLGINIKLDSNKHTMHHKFIVIDGNIVITGSPNFTLAGFSKNDENLLIIHDKRIASTFIKEFESLLQ